MDCRGHPRRHVGAHGLNVTVMHQQVQPIVEELHQAAAAAREEDWPRAEALTQTIREQWQEQVPYLQMVHAHEHTDEATPLPSRPWRGPCQPVRGVCHRGSRMAGTR